MVLYIICTWLSRFGGFSNEPVKMTLYTHGYVIQNRNNVREKMHVPISELAKLSFSASSSNAHIVQLYMENRTNSILQSVSFLRVQALV